MPLAIAGSVAWWNNDSPTYPYYQLRFLCYCNTGRSPAFSFLLTHFRNNVVLIALSHFYFFLVCMNILLRYRRWTQKVLIIPLWFSNVTFHLVCRLCSFLESQLLINSMSLATVQAAILFLPASTYEGNLWEEAKTKA